MGRRVFVFSFGVALCMQVVFWLVHTLIDMSLWVNQAKYFLNNDPRMYSFDLAYAIPGGPLILGTIAFAEVLKTSYEHALWIFFIEVHSAVIALAAVLAYRLRGNIWWSVYVTFWLSLHPLYSLGTPPSILASSLFVLLILGTLSLYEGVFPRVSKHVFFLGALVGFIAAMRIDAGILAVLFVTCALSGVFNLKEWILILSGAFTSFLLWNPFMWINPFQHIVDLGRRLLGNYTATVPMPTQVEIERLFAWSLLACVALILAGIGTMQKNLSLIPRQILHALLGTTIITFFVFMTAEYQAIRYVTPVIIAWEIILPLYVWNFLKVAGKQCQDENYRVIGYMCIHREGIVLTLLCLYPLMTLIAAYVSMVPYR